MNAAIAQIITNASALIKYPFYEALFATPSLPKKERPEMT
jgi:hypothetical protein